MSISQLLQQSLAPSRWRSSFASTPHIHQPSCCIPCQLPPEFQANDHWWCGWEIWACRSLPCSYRFCVPDNSANYVIGGQWSGVANTDFNFSQIEVWSSVHVQTKSFHSENKVMPSQHVSACPPCHNWPLGCYDNVIVNTDNSKHWPWSGFDGMPKFTSLAQYNNINLL